MVYIQILIIKVILNVCVEAVQKFAISFVCYNCLGFYGCFLAVSKDDCASCVWCMVAELLFLLLHLCTSAAQ